MSTLTENLIDEFHQDAIQSLQYDAQLRMEVLYLLEELRDEISVKLTRIDPNASKSEAARTRRQQELFDEVLGLIDATYSQIDKKTNHNLALFSLVFYSITESSINAVFGGKLLDTTVTSDDMKDLVDGLLVTGAPIKEWWSRQRNDLYYRFRDQVRMSLSSNETLVDLLKRIRGEPTDNTMPVVDSKGTRLDSPAFNGGILQPAINAANGLVKTSVQAAANAARVDLYFANDAIVQGVAALVTMDNRTSDLCKSRAGMSWNLDGTELAEGSGSFPGPPPWHMNCRTILIPVFKTLTDLEKANLTPEQRELINEQPSEFKDSFGEPIPSDLTYESWLRTKSEDFQRANLGPGRYQLWKDGKISLTDLVDQSGNPLNLKQLNELAEKRK